MEELIREIKRITLSLFHNLTYHVERRRIEPLLKNFDGRVIENRPIRDNKNITFIITRMVRFHGGQTSILRLGTHLSALGHNVTYVVYKPQSAEDMNICASSNLDGYLGNAMPLKDYRREIKKGRLPYPDIVVASSWDTVSYAKKFTSSHLCYFVQDYEPYFYSFGEKFIMARSTYEQGLHMISLGGWNKRMIQAETHPVSRIDVIPFPYEPGEYVRGERDFDAYAGKKIIKIAVYLKFYGKRLPNLIPWMLENTGKVLSEQGITLEVFYFGEAGSFKPKGGTNLGMLNKQELNDLYNSVDFGMVASMSNISLVPYEMHAAGLPVIEFREGTYTDFLPEDSATLVSICDRDIADTLMNVLKEPRKLLSQQLSADRAMQGLSWGKTAKEFEACVRP